MGAVEYNLKKLKGKEGRTEGWKEEERDSPVRRRRTVLVRGKN